MHSAGRHSEALARTLNPRTSGWPMRYGYLKGTLLICAFDAVAGSLFTSRAAVSVQLLSVRLFDPLYVLRSVGTAERLPKVEDDSGRHPGVLRDQNAGSPRAHLADRVFVGAAFRADQPRSPS